MTKRTPFRNVLAALVLCLGASILPIGAYAFHFPWDQGHDTTKPNTPDDPGPCDTPECDSCNGGASRSPVYAATGHCFWTDTDVVLRGRPYLGISRTFNSNDPVDGLFGNGWAVDFDIALYPATEGATQMRVFKAANGKRFKFVKQANGSFVAPPSRFESVVEGTASVTMTSLDGTRHVFALNGRLIERIDPNGNRVTVSHDASGRPTLIADDNGRSLSIAYNAASRITAITDHGSRTWTYGYDTEGNLVSISDPLSGERRYEYRMYKPTGDGHTYTQLTRVIDPSGVEVVAFTYNGNKVSSYTDGANTFTYSRPSSNTVAGGTVTRTDAMGALETFTYGTQGLVTKDTDALGFQTSYTYDPNGRLTQTTDALGRIWKRSYDSLGRMISSINPLGATATIAYAGNDPRPVRMTSPTGRVMSMTYDVRGNLLTVTDPAGAITRITYGAKGDVTGVANALNQSTAIDSSPLGLPLRVTDPLGRQSTMSYDTLGRVAAATNAGGETVSYAYDALDRIVTVVDPMGQSSAFTYDAAGRLTSVTDAKGSVTGYEYDSHGRRSAEVAPDGRRTTYAYRADNLLGTLTWPDNTTISYTYDANKRVTGETAGGEVITYSYNAVNQLTSASGQGGTVTYTYDNAGRVATETSGGKTNTITRNAEGERIQLSTLGNTQTYTRDLRGLVTRIASAAGNFDFSFDALGRRTRLVYPNSSTASYAYDAAGQLTHLTHAGVFNAPYAHTFDAVGRITRIAGDGPDWNYTYDPLGRLTGATRGTDIFSYSLDAVGNILDGGRTYDENHRLVSDASKTYSYDQRGNLTLEQDRTTGTRTAYSWNFKNQLLRVDFYDDATATMPARTLQYSYDPLGRRASKTDNGATQRFVYDGDDLVGTLDTGNSVVATNVFSGAIDEPLASVTAASIRMLYGNHLGTIAGVAEGAVLTHVYRYSPYGQALAGSSADSTPFRFTSREKDSDNIYYYRARYYASDRQRFISSDPIGLSGGLNTYSYGDGNPILYSDPYGLWTWGDVGNRIGNGAIGAASGGLAGAATGGVVGGVSGAVAGSVAGGVGALPGAAAGAAAGAVAGGVAGAIGGLIDGLLQDPESPIGDTAKNAAIVGGFCAILPSAGGGVLAGRGVTMGVRGGELIFTPRGKSSPDVRINPFGDWDSGKWQGRLPHYHRRPGIDKHRPWERGF